MIRLSIAILTLPLAACAAMSPAAEDRLGVQCNADRVQPLVGREASPDVVERARTRSGARSVRMIKPGMAVTMDFRSDRLNLELDDANMIQAARCG
ncbi:I78 family peptidase inhibitor [Sphingomonas turrisvirgatae]|uniref:Peptidase inhibitor I78 n=1 Tax=Sphingomonas turrisvirgatae TaxID=1888892 RepID=A0A1E3M0E9_9SPHN|nr:I78 family peptidase inhibitor [Sphingomonas turrisvirgatae]ODP39479.1 hypothetical protein BFL28_10460 [Sphingomonas turrisvirgatae]